MVGGGGSPSSVEATDRTPVVAGPEVTAGPPWATADADGTRHSTTAARSVVVKAWILTRTVYHRGS